MVNILFPTDFAPRRLPFFLALEEWLAEHRGNEEEYFFAWQQERPTVICGRNQDIAAEVDTAYCRKSGIDITRRRSGGGAVVADDNNMMLSYVGPTGGRTIEEAFGEWTGRIAGMLRKAGAEAQATGRNDVEIRGRKVSGGAFYAHPNGYIAHSTLILRPLGDELTRALTPSAAKLASKGVKSVAARITSLSEEGVELSRGEIEELFRKELCQGTKTLTEEEIAEIEKIEEAYYKPDFLRI